MVCFSSVCTFGVIVEEYIMVVKRLALCLLPAWAFALGDVNCKYHRSREERFGLSTAYLSYVTPKRIDGPTLTN